QVLVDCSFCFTLLSLISVSAPCVFPFIYKQNSYSSCITNDSENNQPWCATTSNYDEVQQWKYCSTQEHGGNSDGKACAFPFAYKNRTFYSCTNEDDEHGNFWCATTGSYSKDKKWSYCADTRLAANSQGPCVFPFTYKGKSYSSCTTAGSSEGKLWCSLTSNYDVNPKWTYCKPSESLPCTFPFIYNKKSYSACTSDGTTDSLLWCATTTNYDRDSKWKVCAHEEYEGNFNGKACVFPFTYNNRIFFTCTTEGTTDWNFWCATTGSYDADKKWSYCADTRLNAKPKGPCVFPFLYNGVSYSSCTTAGDSNGKLWCSLSGNYNVNPIWTYCQPSEQLPCSFPFTYKKNSYNSCTRDDTTENVLWCATTPDYNTNHKWKLCAVQEYEGNSHGQACVFPFIYKKRTFYTCTNEDTAYGRFWCATTRNYDQDKNWSYCADIRLDSKPTGPCIFPFIYQGRSYSSCTADGDSNGKFWCSLSSNYDVDPKWVYCDHSVPFLVA
ncbi:uncharacterized protein LOC103062755, partial [Python bivittatus]|uniref:Uncharacterized protein LOC103062755 n=1 Tax=Python bivittatus TaxID=176946 RepID=A0A9F5JFA1_PYTBI